MYKIPLPSWKAIAVEAACVLIFCLSFFSFLYFYYNNSSLQSVILDLEQKNSELSSLDRSLKIYSKISSRLLPCNEFKTPLLWEDFSLSFENLKFHELIHHLRFLDRDINKISHREGILLLEYLRMKGTDRDSLSTEQGMGNLASPPSSKGAVFKLKGYLLSTCGDD